MGFLMYCGNKDCGADNEPLLDLATDKVHCSKCGKEMPDVTSFAKVSMRSMGQVKREVKSQLAFAVLCDGCGVSVQPVLLLNKLSCPRCKVEHKNIAAPYSHAIKQFLLTNPRTA